VATNRITRSPRKQSLASVLPRFGVIMCAAVAVACSKSATSLQQSQPRAWVRLVAAVYSTCGLRSDGSAYCWGMNNTGQLGTGDNLDASTPKPVVGGLSFAGIATDGASTCGLTTGGVKYCWGWNQTFGGNSTPRAAVTGGVTFASLASTAPNCGLTSSGVAYCSRGTDSTPVAVPGGLTFASLTGRGRICGLTGSGVAYCWDDAPSAAPVAVAGGLTFTMLTAGSGHTCGLTSAGAAYCWGNNAYGQLGHGDTLSTTAPVPVTGGLTFASLAASDYHTCGLTSAGAAYCWGSNWSGELGDGEEYSGTERSAPVAVLGGVAFVSLTGGQMHTCGVTAAGAAYCWGSNGNGQLGVGPSGDHLTPALVVNP